MTEALATLSGDLFADIEQLAATDILAATERAERALAQGQNQVDAICALAAMHFRAGALGNAVKLLTEVVDREDSLPDVCEALAVLYCLVGQVNDALYFGKRAAMTPSDERLLPLFGPKMPRFREAFATISHKPLIMDAVVAIAAADFDRALFLLRQQLLVLPNDVEALGYYADVLSLTGRGHEAVGILRSVSTLAEPTATILSRLGQCLTNLGELYQADGCHAMAAARAPKSLPILSAWLHDSRFQPWGIPETAFSAWNAALAAGLPKTVRAAPAYQPSERIRIAYLVAGSHSEPVKTMLASVIRAHDRQRFTIIGLGQGEQDAAFNSWTRGTFDSWRDVGQLDPATLSAVIRGEGIHVLIDTDGLLSPDKTGLFQRNAAPIQVSWLNGPVGRRAPGKHFRAVSGLGADAELAMPAGRLFLGGNLGRLAHAGTAPLDINGHVSFGCDLSLAELNPHLIMAFGRILNGVPDSILLLRDRSGIAHEDNIPRIIDMFGNAGIAHRIDIMQSTTAEEFAAASDIVLASFPHCDVLANADLLCMGVPVIANGKTESGRDLAAGLGAAGLGQLAAQDDEGFILAAQKLGNQPDDIRRLRQTIPDLLQNRPAFTAHGFTQNLELGLSTLLDQLVSA